MMNNYLICEMVNNAFTTSASVVINNDAYTFPIKIDTGCTYSVLPYRVLANVTHKASKKIKKNDIRLKLPYKRSYGVSDNDFTKVIDRILVKHNLLKFCNALKFLHKNTGITLNNYSFVTDVYINYDRTGNPLLGLDVLENFIFVCDTSKITGKFTLIGCLKEQGDKEDFYKALLEHFGLIRADNKKTTLSL